MSLTSHLTRVGVARDLPEILVLILLILIFFAGSLSFVRLEVESQAPKRVGQILATSEPKRPTAIAALSLSPYPAKAEAHAPIFEVLEKPPVIPHLDTTPDLAYVGNLLMLSPIRAEDITIIGFHQASGRRALAMQPPPGREIYGRPLTVMNTRGRGTPHRSAVDVGATAGTSVYSPVSGTVVGVRRYALYGRYPDYEIAIRPAKAPKAWVMVLHMSRVTVQPGTGVTAGKTRLGFVANHSSYFKSQLSRYSGEAGDHVHIQVNWKG